MNRLLHAKTECGKPLSPRLRILPLLIGAISLTLSAVAQVDQGRLATPAELRQMRDTEQYRICLQQIGRVMRSGKVGKSYDRYDLLLLRGDCLLHLEDPATAQLAYAAVAASPVPEQAREGRATAILLQRSTKLTYLPNSDNNAGDGINLASKEGRTRALRALLDNDLRAAEPDISRAIGAETLVPIRDVLPKLADLYAIERTATGGDSKLRPILVAIANRARTLLDQDLDLREQSIAVIERRSNAMVDAPVGGWWGGYVRHGLSSNDRGKLRDLIDYLRRIEETARIGRQLATAFDGDATPWDPYIVRATRAIRHAQDVLDAE